MAVYPGEHLADTWDYFSIHGSAQRSVATLTQLRHVPSRSESRSSKSPCPVPEESETVGRPSRMLTSFVRVLGEVRWGRSSSELTEGRGKFRYSQLGQCEWPCGTRRLLPRAEMRASMKGPARSVEDTEMKRFRFGPWPAGHRGVHRSRNHRHRQPRRRWLWRDASVGRPVLGGRHGHPPGYGGPRGSRRAARARGSHPRQPRQPADPGGRTRPDHGHDPGGERGVPDRQPDRGVARPEPAFWATAGGGWRSSSAGWPPGCC